MAVKVRQPDARRHAGRFSKPIANCRIVAAARIDCRQEALEKHAAEEQHRAMEEKEKELQRARFLWEKSWARLFLHSEASRISFSPAANSCRVVAPVGARQSCGVSQRGFVDCVPARTGSRQSRKNYSQPSSAGVSDDLLRKRPKSQRRTLESVALPSCCAIMSMHLRRQRQGRMPHFTFISRPARIPPSSLRQAV